MFLCEGAGVDQEYFLALTKYYVPSVKNSQEVLLILFVAAFTVSM